MTTRSATPIRAGDPRPSEPVHARAADRAVATLTLAFVTDPVIRWAFPHPLDYVTRFPQLVRIMAADALGTDRTDTVADNAGVALWVRPGVELDDEALGTLLMESIDPVRHESALGFLEQVAAFHPAGAHWYLPFIGVEPVHQGHGHGSALLGVGTARADADGLPCYLEASSPRNRALYERHGFQVVGEIQSGDSPPLWPMLRPATPERRTP